MPARLPFAFARDQQVVLEGGDLFTGPGATALGLREARRRSGGAVQITAQSQAAFETTLARLYQQGDQEDSADGLSFESGQAGDQPATEAWRQLEH